MKKIYFLIILLALFAACKKDSVINAPIPPTPKVTSPEYIDSLLFVNKNGYQVQTTDSAATFSSTDSHIILNSKGLITRVTSAEVVKIVITWSNPRLGKTTIYALGAMDTNQDMPFAFYQGALATDAYSSYLEGWKTLQQLPIAGQTYAIVLR